MPTLNSKEQLLEIIEENDFVELLCIKSLEEFCDKPRYLQDEFGLYFANPWDEEGSGVSLFRTPTKGSNYGGDPWGTWLTVSKVFGNSTHPYRVTATDYAPHGTEMDQDEHIGDYETLGEAMDQAFLVHEHGSIDLHVLLEDEDEGRYVRGENEVNVPKNQNPQLSHVSLEVNALVSQRIAAHLRSEQARIEHAAAYRALTEKVWATALTVDEARPVVADIIKKIEPLAKEHDYSYVMLVAATAMNNQLFAGTGKLLSCYCNDLRCHDGIGSIGTVFVAVGREPGEYSFISADGGVFDDAQSAKDSVVAKLKEQYGTEIVDHNLLWLDDTLWEIHLDEVNLDHVDPAEIPEVSEYNCYEIIENRIDDVVVDASRSLRHAKITEKMKQTRQPTARKDQGSEFSP